MHGNIAQYSSFSHIKNLIISELIEWNSGFNFHQILGVDFIFTHVCPALPQMGIESYTMWNNMNMWLIYSFIN
jgi:hypothetical protein